VQATGAAARTSPASPPRAVPWHQAAGHQAIPARSRQSRADTIRPGRESTTSSTQHLRSSPGPADRAMSFASSPCCSPTTPAATSTAPPAPHRGSSPLDVCRRCGEPFMSPLPPIGPPRCRCPLWPLPPLPSTSDSPDFGHRPDGSRRGVRSQARPCPSW
jgi:hypothetical protein